MLHSSSCTKSLDSFVPHAPTSAPCRPGLPAVDSHAVPPTPQAALPLQRHRTSYCPYNAAQRFPTSPPPATRPHDLSPGGRLNRVKLAIARLPDLISRISTIHLPKTLAATTAIGSGQRAAGQEHPSLFGWARGAMRLRYKSSLHIFVSLCPPYYAYILYELRDEHQVVCY
uniref:Predicted protein n=1 Tax=Hordeum vulgare subsp. vulgare TaxID=112509 RepID=F2ECJ4_HORVV|nr:predicted protein [Hordeum vulgare subsp. vulgare]